MSGVAKARAAMAEAKRKNADFFFPESAAWSDGITRRFKVTDPNRTTAESPLRLSTSPLEASLRLVKFHPDDSLPAAGTRVQSANGLVVLGAYTDQGNLFGTRTAVGRLVDERAYPTAAVTTEGRPLRLRVMALDAAALSTTSNDLVTAANNSHRGYLPPGVQLDVGDVLITSDGDQYEVVPPLQRDTLGDTVGLSWQHGGATMPAESSGTDPATPGDTTPAQPGINPDDRWWREGL